MKRFKSPLVPLGLYRDTVLNITKTVKKFHIRREMQKDYSTKVYLDDEQYIQCNDEVLAEYLDLLLQYMQEKLVGMSPLQVLREIEIPQQKSTIIKIVGERIILQLREKDLLNAKHELVERMDEIVKEVYGMTGRDAQ